MSQHPILYTRCPTTDGSCLCSRRVSYSSHQSDSLSPCRMMSWGQMCLNYLFYIQRTPREFPHTYDSSILRGRSGRVLLNFFTCNVSVHLHFCFCWTLYLGFKRLFWLLRHGWTCLEVFFQTPGYVAMKQLQISRLVQRCRAYKCWNADSQLSHWLGCLLTCNSTISSSNLLIWGQVTNM